MLQIFTDQIRVDPHHPRHPRSIKSVGYIDLGNNFAHTVYQLVQEYHLTGYE